MPEKRLAEKLRQFVSSIDTRDGQVTVSIGVATTCAVGGTLQEAIRRADIAMYAAKTAGRNQVMLAA
jgi:diguanylate cyclase (GGDEF)-like protein